MARCCVLLVVAILGGAAGAVGLQAASSVVQAAPSPQTEREAIEAYVQAEMDRLQVPGVAAAVVRDGRIVLAEGFGASSTDGPAVDADTPFAIASVSKWITAIAVLQLVDAGLVELDASLDTYLPQLGSGGQATIIELLTHTSGWTTADGLRNWADAAKDPEALHRNAMRLAGTDRHDAGRYEYSNANYDLLGAVVAQVSGRSFEDYVRTEIFEPIGMEHSYADWDEAAEAGMASGHLRFFGATVAHAVPFVRGSVPSAFLASSANDLALLAMAILNDGRLGEVELLAPSTAALMLRPLFGIDGPPRAIGLRAEAVPTAGTDGRGTVALRLRRSGDLVTYAAEVVLEPDQRLAVVTLMNANDASATSPYHRVATGIADIAAGRPAQPAARTSNPLADLGRPLLLFVVVLQIALATHPRHGHRTIARAHDWLPSVLAVVTLTAALVAVTVVPSVPPLAALRMAPDAAIAITIIVALGVPAIQPRGLRRGSFAVAH